MSDPSHDAPARISTLTVFRVAALFTFLAVAMGSVVCATGSGAACPTWPGCRPDAISPQWELSPIIEFTHRVVAVLSGPLVLAAALMSLRVRAADRWVRTLPWVALAGAVASGVFGRLVVVSTLSTELGAVDLFAALTCMTVMTVAAVRLGAALADTPACSRPIAPHGALVTRLALAGVVTLIALHVTGIFVAGPGSYTRCMGWPMWQIVDADQHPTLQVVRLVLAGLGAALVVAIGVIAWRDDVLRPFGGAVAGLFALEMLLGILIRVQGLSRGVAAAYSVTAVMLLAGLALTAVLAHTRTRADVAERPLATAGR